MIMLRDECNVFVGLAEKSVTNVGWPTQLGQRFFSIRSCLNFRRLSCRPARAARATRASRRLWFLIFGNLAWTWNNCGTCTIAVHWSRGFTVAGWLWKWQVRVMCRIREVLLLLLLQELNIANTFAQANASDAIFGHMVEMTILVTRLVVEFAKHLPGFQSLCKEDQIVLLKVSIAFGINTMRSKLGGAALHRRTRLLVTRCRCNTTAEAFVIWPGETETPFVNCWVK